MSIPAATTPAGPRRRRFRRLTLLLGLAPLAAIFMALLAGSSLPAPSGIAPAIPGVGPPAPAAEAWGRQFKRTWALVKNASAVPDNELGDTANDDPGRCTIEVDINTSSGDHQGAGRGINNDTFCYSYTDSAYVTLTTSDDGIEKGYRAYLSAGRDTRPEAQDWHPGIQTLDSNPARNGNLGRAGLAEYHGKISASQPRRIDLNRNMATPHHLLAGAYFPNKNAGSVFLTVYTEDAAGASGLDNLDGKIDDNGQLADLVHRKDFVVKIYFLNELDLGNTWVFITGVEQNADGSRAFNEWCGRGNPPPCTGPTRYISASGYYHPAPRYAPRSPLNRRLILNDYWLTDDPTKNRYGSIGNSVGRSISSAPQSGIKYCIQLRDYAGNGYWHPGAEKTIRLVFAPGSNLSGASGQYEETRTERHFDAASGACNHLYLNGFNPAGPVRAEMQITINDGQGSIADMEPFNIVIEGPPAALRLTRTPTMLISGGVRYVRIHYAVTDALGSPLTGGRGAIAYRGADDAARAVIDSNSGGGRAGGGRFLLPIKSDAPAGTYSLRLTAGDAATTAAFTVYDLPAPRVITPPAAITARSASGGIVAPGVPARFRYFLQDADGNPLSLRNHPVIWTADDPATQALIDAAVNTDSARQNDGIFAFTIPADTAPGNYVVRISTVATNPDGTPLASGIVIFRVLGNITNYAVAGPDRVAPGGYAVYTITAADANGNLPNLAGNYGAVAISVSDADADADAAAPVRLFNLDDGAATLNREGAARFRLRVDRDATPGRLTITVAGPDGAVTGTRTVAIGAAP